MIASGAAEFDQIVAEQFVEIAGESIENRGQFVVALSGGSTPGAVYRLLASDSFRSRVDWQNVLFFFGDERNVPPDSDQSNFKLAKDNLFDALGISDAKVFRWQTEIGPPEAVASEYSKTIRDTLGTGLPVFDLILLGLGEDGHTASLFPGTAALDETEHYAVSNTVPKLQTTRFTLTFPVINAARHVAFLVTGTKKAGVIKELLREPADLHQLPSRGVRPDPGSLTLFLDAAAAAGLEL